MAEWGGSSGDAEVCGRELFVSVQVGKSGAGGQLWRLVREMKRRCREVIFSTDDQRVEVQQAVRGAGVGIDFSGRDARVTRE